MRKKIFMALMLSLCVAGAQAQSSRLSGVPSGLDNQATDVLPSVTQHRLEGRFAPDMAQIAKKGDITIETVGDPDSFGRAKTYLGLAQTETVILTDPTAPGEEPCSYYLTQGYTQCVETNPAPAGTSVNLPDLASIQLPGKATKSTICFTFTPITQWNWSNTTGSPQTATMFLRPWVRIQSDTLIGLVDLNGNPFVDGVLLDGPISTSLQARTLNDGESDFQYSATTRSCIGGLVSERGLSEGYGLTNAQIKDFFKNPITFSFGVYGSVSMVTSASYLVGVRLYGD
jgi:hypothetical protein